MIFNTNEIFPSLKNTLDEYIQNNRLNKTISRYYILNKISEIDKTFNRKELLCKCEKDQIGITQQAVNDSVKIFEKAKIIRKVSNEKYDVVYEIIID